MGYSNPSVADFKDYFTRDFPYGTDPNTSVLDGDIAKAFQQTNMSISQTNFCDQASYSVGYELLTAHYLCLNINASSQGINGQFNWGLTSKSAGSVSQASAIPQRILDNPYLSMLSRTRYGALYLELLLPNLVGQIGVVCGSTRP